MKRDFIVESKMLLEKISGWAVRPGIISVLWYSTCNHWIFLIVNIGSIKIGFNRKGHSVLQRPPTIHRTIKMDPKTRTTRYCRQRAGFIQWMLLLYWYLPSQTGPKPCPWYLFSWWILSQALGYNLTRECVKGSFVNVVEKIFGNESQ